MSENPVDKYLNTPPNKSPITGKRLKRLYGPEWSAKLDVKDGKLYVDITRMLSTKDSLFFTMEKQSFAVPKSVIKQILRKKC